MRMGSPSTGGKRGAVTPSLVSNRRQPPPSSLSYVRGNSEVTRRRKKHPLTERSCPAHRAPSEVTVIVARRCPALPVAAGENREERRLVLAARRFARKQGRYATVVTTAGVPIACCWLLDWEKQRGKTRGEKGEERNCLAAEKGTPLHQPQTPPPNRGSRLVAIAVDHVGCLSMRMGSPSTGGKRGAVTPSLVSNRRQPPPSSLSYVRGNRGRSFQLPLPVAAGENREELVLAARRFAGKQGRHATVVTTAGVPIACCWLLDWEKQRGKTRGKKGEERNCLAAE
nr:hypothetical protein Iba_chr14cCG3720 [Ipomoea batatas]